MNNKKTLHLKMHLISVLAVIQTYTTQGIQYL